MQPLGARVLVEQVASIARVGVLHVPEKYQRTPTRGRVIALGPACGPALQVGDRVWFTKYTGEDVELGGRPYLLIEEADVLGVLEGDDDEVGAS